MNPVTAGFIVYTKVKWPLSLNSIYILLLFSYIFSVFMQKSSVPFDLTVFYIFFLFSSHFLSIFA